MLLQHLIIRNLKKMLSVSVTESPLLSVSAGNWSKFDKHLRGECRYAYGESGLQIQLDKEIPLDPFLTMPNKDDLDIHSVTGLPIALQFTYPRVKLAKLSQKAALVAAKRESPEAAFIFMSNFPLSEHGEAKLSRDKKIYRDALKSREDSDKLLHTALASRTSAESITSLETQSQWPIYLAAPMHKRSFIFYKMLQQLHQIGNAAVKFARTTALFQHHMGTDSLQTFISDHTSKFEQFRCDFESTDPEHKGYIHLGELKSFLFLHGVDRSLFSKFINDQLTLNATGRIPDTTALISKFVTYSNSLAMTIEPESVQGSALASAATASPAATTARTSTGSTPTKRRCEYIHTNTNGNQFESHTHTTAECSLNPASTNFRGKEGKKFPRRNGKAVLAAVGAATEAPATPTPSSSNAASSADVAKLTSMLAMLLSGDRT